MEAKAQTTMGESPQADLDDPGLFINRELSWLEFNRRVLEEALDPSLPLLERVKFLAIFANNLDEFFMIRVSGLRRQEEAGVPDLSPDGMTAAEQLIEIRRILQDQLARKSACWHEEILPRLKEAGIRLLRPDDLRSHQKALLRDYFERQIFPVLTPLAFDPAHPWPHISGLSLNFAVVVKDRDGVERFARLKVPDIFPRFLPIPDEVQSEQMEILSLIKTGGARFVLLEDVVAMNLDLLFPGLEVVAGHSFRITRDADIELEEDEAADLLSTIEEGVEARQFGQAVRLQVYQTMPEQIREILIHNLKLAPYLVYTSDCMLGMSDLMDLYKVDRPDLKFPAFIPVTPPALAQPEGIFAAMRRRDVLLYHPYDSFTQVTEFVSQAARDPQVLAIKQTLYRVGPNSPIVGALMEARQEGKQVAVVVELKARFDEENNIAWARALEAEGVHVSYGLMGLKTHAKLCLVVRREGAQLRRYVHLSTGNYNPVTARIYTDLGYFTTDPQIGADVSDLFNSLTGYSSQSAYRKLLVAPGHMKDQLVARIDREIRRHREHGDGRLIFKMNALVDQKIIKTLYRASQAGVKIDLQVRGICSLRPGVEGVSENIRVTSIVGRFLEHTRMYYFHNGGEDELFTGSADLMPRNLHRRVEVLFPVSDPEIKREVMEALRVHLADNQKCRVLGQEGPYERVAPGAGEEPVDSQSWLLEHWGGG